MESSEMDVETSVVAEEQPKTAEVTTDTSLNPKDTADTEAFPSISIEINSAETISEDAFDEDKTDDTSTENLFQDYDSTIEVTPQKTKDTETQNDSEDVQSKEQEPVNESNESGSKAFDDAVVNSDAGVIKQEADDGGDVPNEDPNRDTADSDQEMDPEVAAALEASLLETEQMDEDEAEEEQKKQDGAAPIMMFRNETEVDTTEDESVGTDPDVVTENALTGDEMTLDGEAVTGEMEIGGAFSLGDGNPLEAGDGNPLLDEDPGDYDPLVEDGDGIAVDPQISGFLDQVNSGFMTQIHAFPETSKTRGARGKKKNDLMDDDYDPLAPASAPKTARKSARGTLQCSICHFPFQSCIGELKLHKYTDHDNQAKPSYLDLAEVAISKLSSGKGGGVSTQKILKEILSDPMTTDGNAKAKNILARALKFGLSSGRLRSGKPGIKCQRYFLAKKGPNRKSVFDKFNKNKKLVEFDDNPPPKPKPKPKPVAPKNLKVPSNITVTKVRTTENSKATATATKAPAAKAKPIPKHADSIGIPNNTSRLGRGKRSNGLTVTLDSDSDSDIEIVSEKITPKPKRKVTIVRVPANRPNTAGKPMVTSSKPGTSKLPSNLVRVGSSKPGGVKVVPRPGVSTPAKKEEKKSVWDDDDDDLTCRICQSAFWFKSQLTEHMEKTHSRSIPETKSKK